MRIPTKGSLAQSNLIAILSEFAENRMTGMVRVESGAAIKVVYFQQGTIAYASSNDRSDRLTEVLKRAGKLTQEQIDHAQARVKPGVSLGKTLVELGYLTSKELLWGARMQVEAIIHQLLFWKSGTYQILEGPLPKEIVSLNINVFQIIFSGIVKSQDRPWVLERIGSPEAVYSLSEEFHLKNATYRLPIETVVSRINGKRTLNDIAQSAGLDGFEVCKAVAALEILGMATRAKEKPIQMPLVAEAPTKHETSTVNAAETRPVPVPQSQDLSLGEVLQIPTVEELQKEAEERPNELLLVPQEEKEIFPVSENEMTKQSSDVEEIPFDSDTETNHVVFVPLDLRDRPRTSIFGISPHRSVILIAAVLALGIGFFIFLSYLISGGSKTENKYNSVRPKPNPRPVTMSPVTKKSDPVSPRTLAETGRLPEAALLWQSSLIGEEEKYTLQLVLACQEKTVLDTLRALGDSPNLMIVPADFNGQTCYRVIQGTYPSESEALAAKDSLRKALRGRRLQAQVVSISRIVQ